MFKKRYIIIDRDEKFSQLATSIIDLSEKFFHVNTYQTCEDAIRNLRKDEPDVILMDLNFEQMKGDEAIDTFKRTHPEIEILIISDVSDDAIILKVITLGATGFLQKRTCLPFLADSLIDVVSGRSPLHSTIARKLLDNLRINLSSPLTTRENQILKKITQGKPYSMIADELNISHETSKTHIKNIYRKLKVNSKSQVIKKAISERWVSSL